MIISARPITTAAHIFPTLFFGLPRAWHPLDLGASLFAPGNRMWPSDPGSCHFASLPGHPQHRSQADHTRAPAPVTAHKHRVLHQAARHRTRLPGRRPASQTETLERPLTGSPQEEELRMNVSWIGQPLGVERPLASFPSLPLPLQNQKPPPPLLEALGVVLDE